MHALILGARFDDDVNARLVLFGDNINIGCCISGRRCAIGTDIVSAHRKCVQTGNFF